MGTTYYHWDPIDDCVMMETDGAGNTIVTYTREPGKNGPLLSENRDSGWAGLTADGWSGLSADNWGSLPASNPTEYYHHYDALGSTTMLTDDTGTVTDTFQYDAWGNVIERTGTTPTPYQWIGRWGYQTDPITGTHYVRARQYSPQIARWQSPDPIWPKGGLNQFVYVSNIPVLLIDPTGLKCTVCGGAWKIYRAEIEGLDAYYEGTPFRDLADGHKDGVNELLADDNWGVGFPQLPDAGLYLVHPKGRTNAALGFLFFVVFDICETKPGDCRLYLDERGSVVTSTDGKGNLRLKGGKNEKDVTGKSTVTATLITPSNPKCPQSIIFVDIPFAAFILKRTKMSVKLRQKIEIRDRAAGENDPPLASTENNLDFSVDAQGNFSPPPDFIPN